MEPADAEERLRLITETISEVFWLAAPDLMRTAYVSPAFERIWRRTCQSLYDKPQSFLDPIHPDDLPRVLRNLEVKHQGLPFEHEYRIVWDDCTVRWIWDRGFPVRGADGGVEYYLGVAQDITERKTAELELATLAERFSLVSHATTEGVWDWNMITNVTWWSDAHYDELGYDRAVPPSYEAWRDRIHPDDRERVLKSLAAAVDGRARGWSDDYRFMLPDGRVLDIFDRAHVLYDDAGTPTRMVGAMMDVTARRSLEVQLRHAQKMDAIGQLAGGIAHDFNNILQAMMLEISFMRAAPDVPPGFAMQLDDLKDCTDRAANLTRQLLMFSRRELVRPQWLDVNAVIADLARMLHRILREDIALQLALAPGALWVHGDPGLLDQVLVNLAVNARDAMPRGGALSITTSACEHAGGGGRPPGRYARVLVRDTGSGIPDDVRPHIFEPFFTTKKSGEGTGLGLATAFGIVQQHRGWIEVDSELGHGSAFTMYLPAGAAPTDAVAAGDTQPLATIGSETVLVVEDDAGLRRLVRRVFESRGYRVLEADHAAAAIEAWDRARGDVDVVVTDLVMPGGVDGWELAMQLEGRRPGVPIVFATGYHRDMIGRELQHNHALLHKPVDVDSLLAAVRSSLDGATGS